MLGIIVLLGLGIAYFGLYWLISDEIEGPSNEIKDELKWIEKQNNLLRQEVNDLRLQVDDMWKNVKKIVNNKD